MEFVYKMVRAFLEIGFGFFVVTAWIYGTEQIKTTKRPQGIFGLIFDVVVIIFYIAPVIWLLSKGGGSHYTPSEGYDFYMDNYRDYYYRYR